MELLRGWVWRDLYASASLRYLRDTTEMQLYIIPQGGTVFDDRPVKTLEIQIFPCKR